MYSFNKQKLHADGYYSELKENGILHYFSLMPNRKNMLLVNLLHDKKVIKSFISHPDMLAIAIEELF
jgi:hypothetical protein